MISSRAGIPGLSRTRFSRLVRRPGIAIDQVSLGIRYFLGGWTIRKRAVQRTRQAGGEDVGFAAGRETVQQRLGVGEHLHLDGRHHRRIVAREQQRLKHRGTAFGDAEMTGGAQIDVVQAVGYDVLRIRGGFVEAQQSKVAHRPGTQTRAHAERVSIVRHHFAVRKLHTPTAQQRLQVGCAALGHGGGIHRGRRHVDFGKGVEEDQRPPAAEHELVDGIQRFGFKVSRMHQPEHIDVFVYFGEPRGNRAHLEELSSLTVHDPGLGHALGLGVESRGHGNPGMHTHNDLVGTGEAEDQPRQFVLEKPFPVRIENLDDFPVADAVGGGKPEVKCLPDPEADRLQAELCRLVFLLGERHRIDDVQHQVAARGPLEFLEHFANPAGVVPERRDIGGLAIGEEQVDVDGLDDGREHVSRSGRNGIEVVFRQIDAQAREQRIVRRHRRDEDQPEKHQRQNTEITLTIGCHCPDQPAFFIWSTSTLA